MTAQSTQSANRRKASNRKPEKPYKDFPLFPHATGRWAKKILGKLNYFGKWDDWQAALDLYLEQKDDLYAGRKPRRTGEGLTIRDLCNRFLTSKQHQVDTGEIATRTFADYKSTTDRIVSMFGKTRLVDDLAADDFEQLRADIAKTRGVVSLGNEITRARVVFNYAYQNHLIEKPVRYGSSFKKPSKRVLRKARNDKGARMFESGEIHKMLNVASTQLHAMILLGVNCGFGNEAPEGRSDECYLNLGPHHSESVRFALERLNSDLVLLIRAVNCNESLSARVSHLLNEIRDWWSRRERREFERPDSAPLESRVEELITHIPHPKI